MEETTLEKRLCVRFQIPGAEVKYKKESTFFRKAEFNPEAFPLVDISRGGIRFYSHEIPKFDTHVIVELFIPDDPVPLVLEGTVRWYSPTPDARYKYHLGVQLFPYGEGKGHNPQHVLKRIIDLEKQFLETVEPPDEGPETI